MHYVSTDIVFQEVPGETTLAFSISGCPYRCTGCHSAHLREKDLGKLLTKEELDVYVNKYDGEITCVCIMGGDSYLKDLYALARHVRDYHKGLKFAWYSGSEHLPPGFPYKDFDYVKVGPYREEMGPLNVCTTNQKMFAIKNGELSNITYKFWRHG